MKRRGPLHWSDPLPPQRRGRFHVTRARLARFVGALLAIEVVRQSSHLSGWNRLGLVVVALVILFVSIGRRPE